MEDRAIQETIKNADIQILTQIHSIMTQVTYIERQRLWEQERMGYISQHLSGMPGGGAMPRGLDEAFARLAEIDDEHAKRCKVYVRQLKKAQKILNSIENINMRTYVMMRYIFRASDTEIRKELNMTRRGIERARKCIEEAPDMGAVKWHDRYIIERDEKTKK